jgi:hypothetical protein
MALFYGTGFPYKPLRNILLLSKPVVKNNIYVEEIVTLFKAYNPEVEVSGESVISFLEGVGMWAPSAQKLLNENGIKDPVAGEWYSQQAYLNGFKQVAQKTGPAVLRNIGRTVPEHAKWPPQINSIESGLSSINVAYHMNHRKGNIGNYTATKVNPKLITMVCDDPYPDSFDFGLIEYVAKKFSKPGERVAVKIDESKPQRDKGAESTTYIVEW